jgi:hypothetical protein
MGEFSGPGRALDFHLDLANKVHGAMQWARTYHATEVWPQDLPEQIKARLRLRSIQSGAWPLGEPIDRADYIGKVYTEENLTGTLSSLFFESGMLQEAETHYVSQSVMQTITAIAEKSDPDPLFPTDLPAPAGLIVFESVLRAPDPGLDPGNKMTVRAIGWKAGVVGQMQPDGSIENKAGISYFIYDHIDSGPDNDVFVDLGIWLTDSSGWVFGQPWYESEDRSATHPNQPSAEHVGAIHPDVAWMRKWIWGYMRWTWQKIIVSEQWHPDRARLKRMARSKAMIDGYIKVLKLRRTEYRSSFDRDHESDEMYYEHQFMVRGHQRYQWYPSLGPCYLPDGSKNPDSHRQIWIDPFIKGNPDGPLVIGHNVSASVR